MDTVVHVFFFECALLVKVVICCSCEANVLLLEYYKLADAGSLIAYWISVTITIWCPQLETKPKFFACHQADPDNSCGSSPPNQGIKTEDLTLTSLFFIFSLALLWLKFVKPILQR